MHASKNFNFSPKKCFTGFFKPDIKIHEMLSYTFFFFFFAVHSFYFRFHSYLLVHIIIITFPGSTCTYILVSTSLALVRSSRQSQRSKLTLAAEKYKADIIPFFYQLPAITSDILRTFTNKYRLSRKRNFNGCFFHRRQTNILLHLFLSFFCI